MIYLHRREVDTKKKKKNKSIRKRVLFKKREEGRSIKG